MLIRTTLLSKTEYPNLYSVCIPSPVRVLPVIGNTIHCENLIKQLVYDIACDLFLFMAIGSISCIWRHKFVVCTFNNRFHSEAKLPWSYDHPLANHIATNKSSANREMPLFCRLCPCFGCPRKIFRQGS